MTIRVKQESLDLLLDCLTGGVFEDAGEMDAKIFSKIYEISKSGRFGYYY